mgnify:CR=1 FL=1
MTTSVIFTHNSAMKKNLLLLFIPLCLVFFNSCKKCFSCHNECIQCIYADSLHTFTHTLCKDSFANDVLFQAAVNNDSTAGFACLATAPTYTYDFCSNQPGEQTYTNYFNKGKREDLYKKTNDELKKMKSREEWLEYFHSKFDAIQIEIELIQQRNDNNRPQNI